MTWGDKFSSQEVDDAFAEFKIDDGQIDAGHLKGLMVSILVLYYTTTELCFLVTSSTTSQA